MPNANHFKTHEEYLQWYRDYRKKNNIKFRLYQRNYNRKWRKINGFHNEIKWKKNNPEKVTAGRLAQYAEKIGKLKKRECELCGFEYTVKHHPDYTKPLKVIYLCHICHKLIHTHQK